MYFILYMYFMFLTPVFLWLFYFVFETWLFWKCAWFQWIGQIQGRLQRVVKLWSETLPQCHVYIPVIKHRFLPLREQDHKPNHHCPQASTQRRIKHEPGLTGGSDKYSLNIRIYSLCQKGVCCVNLHTLMMKASVDFKVPLSEQGQGKVASRKKSIFSCWFGSSVVFSAALIK